MGSQQEKLPDITFTNVIIAGAIFVFGGLVCTGMHNFIPENYMACFRISGRAWFRWLCVSECGPCGWCCAALLMERELQKVKEKLEAQKQQNELLITRLQNLESNGPALTTADGEEAAFTQQKVDLALSQIITLEKSFHSLQKMFRATPLPSQLMLEPQETVSHTSCPIEFPDQLHES
jgi:hypothetical protein